MFVFYNCDTHFPGGGVKALLTVCLTHIFHKDCVCVCVCFEANKFVKIYLGVYHKRSWDVRSLWRKVTLHVAIIHKLLLRSTCLYRIRSLIEAERSLVKNGANFLIWFFGDFVKKTISAF